MKRTSFIVGFLFLLLILLSGFSCSKGAQLKGRLITVKDKVMQAERNGAYKCAPRELARAKAHTEFAEVEFNEGYFSRAEYHFNIASPAAQAAYDKSPPEKCAPPAVLLEECIDDDGDSICEESDQCPEDPEDFDGVEDTDGCPEDQDTDEDRVMDSRDQCVVVPEDRDGYQDDDGCPDPDNDLDGIPDEKDKCIDDPEDPDGYKDEDGCPDPDNDFDQTPDIEDNCPNEAGPPAENGCPREYTDVVITDTHIKINQKIHFEYNKSKIRSVSYPILNTVARVLKDFPNIAIRIEGHTDSRGSGSYNKKLSNNRAKSVRTYLIGQGIDSSRMTSIGYGEDRPIASNRTKEGRAQNRRVEFVRTDVPQQ